MKKLLIIVIVAGIAVAVLLFKNKSAIAPEDGGQTVCTQDAKQCPDGSYVSRQGPNCEFAPCPTVVSSASQSVNPTTSAKATPSTSAMPQPQTVTLTFANGTVTPNNVTIRVGDTVKFVNNDSALRWPASGPHPTHTTCSGFDALSGLKLGESYSFTFNMAKTCPWHDHLKPSINGQIVVNP